MTEEVPFENAWDRKDWAKEIAELQKSLEKERKAKLSISKQYKESVERLEHELERERRRSDRIEREW